MPTVETTLYFANWCGHCHKFMDEWDSFTAKINNKYGGEIKGTNNMKVITNKYEESSIKYEPTINNKKIRGYPTVKISIKNEDGRSVEYEYSGKRTSDALIDHLKNHALNNLKNSDDNDTDTNDYNNTGIH